MSASPVRIAIIIPAYNEGPVINSVVTTIRSHGYNHVIVVDDGSGDNTWEEAQSAHAIAVRHIVNRGKGASVKTGIEAALIRNADIIVTCDGDGQHDPRDIKKLIHALNQGYDVALGSRMLNRSTMPLIRKIANGIGNMVTWMLYGLWVTDSQSGLRAYTRRACQLLETVNDRYEYDSEVFREIVKHHLRYKEVPINTMYTAYSQSKKHKQSFMNGLRTLIKLLITS